MDFDAPFPEYPIIRTPTSDTHDRISFPDDSAYKITYATEEDRNILGSLNRV